LTQPGLLRPTPRWNSFQRCPPCLSTLAVQTRRRCIPLFRLLTLRPSYTSYRYRSPPFLTTSTLSSQLLAGVDSPVSSTTSLSSPPSVLVSCSCGCTDPVPNPHFQTRELLGSPCPPCRSHRTHRSHTRFPPQRCCRLGHHHRPQSLVHCCLSRPWHTYFHSLPRPHSRTAVSVKVTSFKAVVWKGPTQTKWTCSLTKVAVLEHTWSQEEEESRQRESLTHRHQAFYLTATHGSTFLLPLQGLRAEGGRPSHERRDREDSGVHQKNNSKSLKSSDARVSWESLRYDHSPLRRTVRSQVANRRSWERAHGAGGCRLSCVGRKKKKADRGGEGEAPGHSKGNPGAPRTSF